MTELTKSALADFTGSETFYRHGLMRNIVYTEGAQFVAEHGGAYWLLDKIATNQLNKPIGQEEFQVWKFVVDGEKHTGLITVEDGNGKSIHQEAVDYTDFPLDEITLWFTNNTILLPSEY